jgi:acyl-CoA dehydrogenase
MRVSHSSPFVHAAPVASCTVRRMTTTYPLTPEDREIQERARTFVDEQLIPWEQHAEEHGGTIPDEAREQHHVAAIDLGFYAMNLPEDLGGTGYTTLQQVLVSE